MNGWSWLVAAVWISNGPTPRVPPSFVDARCMETIDRAIDPRFEFAIGIPFEHEVLTADEPPGSRRFRFFTVCRDLEPQQTLPTWISWADVDSARSANPSIEMPTDADVLETSGIWADCVRPIPADPLAISCRATASDMVWDAAAWPLGTHVVWGYTYEPANNLWTPRSGVVRVVETRDGTVVDGGPAVAFSFPATSVSTSTEAGVVVHGCVAGDGALELSVQWTTAGELGDADSWREFWRTSTTTGTFAVPFDPPDELAYQAVFLRAAATDDRRRSFVAYTREPIVLVPGCEAPRGGAPRFDDACGVATEPSNEPPPTAAGECEPSQPAGSPDPSEADEDAPDRASMQPDEPAAGSCTLRRQPTGTWVCVFAWMLVTVHARRKSDRR